MNIIQALRPYRTALTLRGPDALLRQFAATPAGQRIVIIGFVQLGDRQLHVSRIEAAPAKP